MLCSFQKRSVPPSVQEKSFPALSQSEWKSPAQVEEELGLPYLSGTSGDLPQHNQEGGGGIVLSGQYWELDPWGPVPSKVASGAQRGPVIPKHENTGHVSPSSCLRTIRDAPAVLNESQGCGSRRVVGWAEESGLHGPQRGGRGGHLIRIRAVWRTLQRWR